MLPSRLRFLRGRRPKPPEWAPPTLEQYHAALIDCVVEMCELGPDEHSGYMTAHWIFQRKVLGRENWIALKTAARVQDIPLDRSTCERMVRDWWKCSICGGQVADGEDDTCPACAVEVADAA